MPERVSGKGVGMPVRVFMYTVDQISVMTQIDEASLHRSYIYHEGRDVGSRKAHEMLARNVAPPGEKAEWRIVDREFIRWLKGRGFRYYERGYATV